jgi:hypothetical protein
VGCHEAQWNCATTKWGKRQQVKAHHFPISYEMLDTFCVIVYSWCNE